MNYTKLILGIIGVVVAGCASDSAIRIADNDDILSRREDRVGHPEIRLKTIFGINEEMLADTNRFPVSSSRWHEFDLSEDMGGFKTVKFSLTDNNGKFGIFNVEMKKTLPAESDDDELYREFKSAVDMVGKAIGVELKCPALMEMDEWRRRWQGIVDSDFRLSSEFRIDVADGYSIKIEAKDATYVRRQGKLNLVGKATVEVEVRNDGAELRPGRLRVPRKKNKPVAVAREVEFGADLSGLLSEATKDNAMDRNSPEYKDRKMKMMVKAAASGSLVAMHVLTYQYRFGHNVKADQNLAFKYSKMAADAGDARGIADLASCYEEGRGTEKDVVKAAALWKKAAEMGNAYAVSRYARCLAKGIGVKQDPERAAELFAMCASRPHANPWTIVQIASFCLRGFGVEKDEAKARAWLDRLEARAEDGDLSAINILVKFYLDGEKGVGKDAARAYKMAQLAAEAEAVWGYKAMARCFKDGIGVEKNPAKAKEYIEKALKKCKGGSCDHGELQKMLKELDGGR